ncbi:MAG: glycogen-binding domain-containing protein [Lentisphaeria bacterium]|nr:glycogen-binding domain-containing protein [Lentisphaeria bacterium]MBQ9776154.1 glycogen-binding domain-containing protein [Lentisphaeria bacterium]
MLSIEKNKGGKLFQVTFTATAAAGTAVFIAGSFNDWDADATPMLDCGGNVHKVTLELPAGYYEYKFIVGDEWLLDDSNPNFSANDFGTLNSFFVLE